MFAVESINSYHQDMCRYYQYSLNEQISDYFYHIYENLSLDDNLVLLFIKTQHMQFQKVIPSFDDSSEMYLILISLCFGIDQSC